MKVNGLEYYTAVYKCRNCGRECRSPYTSTKEKMMSLAHKAFAGEYDPAVPMLIGHQCSDKHIGVADFIRLGRIE